MFQKLRESLRHLADGTLPPEHRREAVARMKETLVQARMGLDDLRVTIERTGKQLAAETRELETVRRRRTLAEGIKDQETVTVAERYERQHAERVALLSRKVEMQTEELRLAEREVEEMTAELKMAARGVPGAVPGAAPSTVDPLTEDDRARAEVQSELDGLARSRARAAHEQTADEKLAELKRRMGR